MSNDSSSDDECDGLNLDDLPINANTRQTYDMQQCKNHQELRRDIDYGWVRDDSAPLCAPFTGNLSLKVDLPDSVCETDFFQLLFDDSMWI